MTFKYILLNDGPLNVMYYNCCFDYFHQEKKEMDLKINDSAIIWPGETRTKPAGFMIPTHLRVLTIEETPFVFVRKVDTENDCRNDEEPCPHFNTTEDGTTTIMIVHVHTYMV